MAESIRTRFTLAVGEAASTDVRLTAVELAVAAGISTTRLGRLVDIGVIEPDAAGGFSIVDLARLKRVLRLHRDLGVNLIGAAIISDLVDRLDELEAKLRR